MRIQKLVPGDFQRVFEMMKVFYASDALLIHPDEQTIRTVARYAVEDGPYVTGYGFWEGEELAGYGTVTRNFSSEAGGICVWIEDIYVRPEYRGMGVGSGFLRFVEEEYRHTAVRIRLEAEPENERAMAVYRKAGFEVLGYTQLVKELKNK